MNLRDAYTITGGFDPNEEALNRYLRQYDEDDCRADFIETRTEELLADEYSPYRPDNLTEAIGEWDRDALAAYALCIRMESYQAAGEMLDKCIKAYWLKLATAKAETEYDEGAE